jgi:sugar lactone lactonase YvrE
METKQRITPTPKKGSTKETSGLKLKLAIAFICISGFTMAQTVTTLAGSSRGSCNGIGAAANFSDPFGLTTDGKGNLYVADASNGEIRKVVISTGLVSTLAGTTIYGTADGIGSAARFYSPTGIAFDGDSNLYVADALNNEIRKVVISTGAVTTFAGDPLSGFNDGTGTNASFFSPTAICYDGKGNLYVADRGNNEIRKIVIATRMVTTFAGTHRAGSSDGIGASAGFYEPTGITTDGNGTLYVADNFNNEIRSIDIATAMVTTLAGSQKTGFNDGIGSEAGFNGPSGIIYDKHGMLYITDAHNNEIRQITIGTGLVSTIAGSPNPGSLNGPASGSSFNGPIAITIDNNCNLYITDQGNNEIRMISNFATGVNNLSASTNISIYPNPAHQTINFNIPVQSETSYSIIRVFDMTGKEMISENRVITNNEKISVDVNNLQNGMYFLQVVINDNTMPVERFIKQ